MATRVTRWLPDTCQCELDYIWDDAKPDVEGQVVLVKACPAHRGKQGGDVLAENRRKNTAIAQVAEALAIEPTEVGWEWDAQRNLVLRLPAGKALPPSLARQLQAMGVSIQAVQ